MPETSRYFVADARRALDAVPDQVDQRQQGNASHRLDKEPREVAHGEQVRALEEREHEAGDDADDQRHAGDLQRRQPAFRQHHAIFPNRHPVQPQRGQAEPHDADEHQQREQRVQRARDRRRRHLAPRSARSQDQVAPRFNHGGQTTAFPLVAKAGPRCLRLGRGNPMDDRPLLTCPRCGMEGHFIARQSRPETAARCFSSAASGRTCSRARATTCTSANGAITFFEPDLNFQMGRSHHHYFGGPGDHRGPRLPGFQELRKPVAHSTTRRGCSKIGSDSDPRHCQSRVARPRALRAGQDRSTTWPASWALTPRPSSSSPPTKIRSAPPRWPWRR